VHHWLPDRNVHHVLRGRGRSGAADNRQDFHSKRGGSPAFAEFGKIFEFPAKNNSLGAVENFVELLKIRVGAALE